VREQRQAGCQQRSRQAHELQDPPGGNVTARAAAPPVHRQKAVPPPERAGAQPPRGGGPERRLVKLHRIEWVDQQCKAVLVHQLHIAQLAVRVVQFGALWHATGRHYLEGGGGAIGSSLTPIGYSGSYAARTIGHLDPAKHGLETACTKKHAPATKSAGK
jgi:hypothetical protein